MRWVRLLSSISIAAAIVIGCGGGGGGGGPAGGAPSTSSFSGVAIDGNLYLARAFLDLNGNGSYDAGEPAATTGSSGDFSLTATQDQINSHSVVITAISGTTVDQDDPNTPIVGGFTMVAPAGHPSVVSPLTTQVVAKMAEGFSLSDAKASVQADLGLSSVDVMLNYVSEKASNSAYLDVHKVAVAIAEVLKTVESSSTASTSLTDKLTSVKNKVAVQIAPQIVQIKAASSVANAKGLAAISVYNSESGRSYTLGGSISGLTGAGLVIANNTDTISVASSGTAFTFAQKLGASESYSVAVKTQPSGQTCTVSNASGAIATQSVSNVAITCRTNSQKVGGTITGLSSAGLVLLNGAEQLSISSGVSTFQFQNSVSVGANYSVTVQTQPTGKTCNVANASGTMVAQGINNVTVVCANNSYSLSGSVSGLTTSGLKVKVNGSESITIASGAQTFAASNQIAYGSSYGVVIETQPTGQSCSVSNSQGTMGAANVTAVQVTCATNSYWLGGAISGLSTDGLRLRNGTDLLAVSSGATSFTMGSPVAYQGTYALTVDIQPTGKTCTVSNGSGQMAASDVSSVSITCVSTNYAPVAQAGVNQSVATGATVRLDATGSSDVNGDSLTYLWELRVRPDGSNAVLSSTTASNPTFVADVDGYYMAVLVVSDGRLSSTNSALTGVQATTARANSEPLASASANAIAVIGSPVTLDGSGSSDANGDSLTYSWEIASKPNGSNAVLSSTTVVRPTFTPDIAGDYSFTLRTNDGRVDSYNVANVTVTAVTHASNVSYTIASPDTSGDGSLSPSYAYTQTFYVSQASTFLGADFSFLNKEGTGQLQLEIYRGLPDQPQGLIYSQVLNVTSSTYVDNKATFSATSLWGYLVTFNATDTSGLMPIGRYFIKLKNISSNTFYIDSSWNLYGGGNRGSVSGVYYSDYPDSDMSFIMRLKSN